MTAYQRAVRGAEAGAISAGVLEISFFLLDLVRLRPLTTPVTLSGASIGPGASALDLSNLTGVLEGVWTVYQILLLTFSHFLTFVVVGVAASLLFDWSRPGGIARLAVVAVLCTVAFFATVAMSSSMVALGAVGVVPVVAMNLLAALALAAGLRVASHEAEGSSAA